MRLAPSHSGCEVADRASAPPFLPCSGRGCAGPGLRRRCGRDPDTPARRLRGFGLAAAATTGIPDGTPALTVLSDASIHTTADDQVLDAFDLVGRLSVDHKDVAIRRSRLSGDEYYAVYATSGGTGLTIEDSDLLGSSRTTASTAWSATPGPTSTASR